MDVSAERDRFGWENTGDSVDSSATMWDVLCFRSKHQPADCAYRFIGSGDPGDATEITFSSLHAQATKLGQTIECYGSPGDRALLLFEPGLEFIVALFACFAAGRIAVPVPAPHPRRIKQKVDPVLAILEDCEPNIVIASHEQYLVKDSYAAIAWQIAVPTWLEVSVADTGTSEIKRTASIAARDDVALLQYTSGSTSTPKGVVLTHQNLMCSQEHILEVTALPLSKEMVLSWMPHYHDMGLSCFLQTAYVGATLTLVPPSLFVSKPNTWLQLIDRYRICMTASTNFALEHLLAEADDEKLSEIDLSCLQRIIVGAEPIRADTLGKFLKRFKAYGLRESALRPCYGMAEATVIITGAREAPIFSRFREIESGTGTLSYDVVDEHDSSQSSVRLVSNGKPAPGQSVAIVDPDTMQILSERMLGEIWFRGSAVGQGYWGVAGSENTFRATIQSSPEEAYLRTGDLGFVHLGNLYITGRRKEVLNVNGRNIFPGDVEACIRKEDQENLVGSGFAVVEVSESGIAGLLILFEQKRRGITWSEAMLAEMRNTIVSAVGVDVFCIAVCKQFQLPRTTSGKIQMWKCGQQFAEGALKPLLAWKP